MNTVEQPKNLNILS